MFIIPMIEEHLGHVLEIERDNFITPWSYEDFTYEINVNDYGFYYSLVIDDEVIGFIGSTMVQDQCEITTLAVHKNYRGHGYGFSLLQHVLAIAYQKQCNSITLEVRISNDCAIHLYKKAGFEIATVRKKYYQDNNEDAYLMIR